MPSLPPRRPKSKTPAPPSWDVITDGTTPLVAAGYVRESRQLRATDGFGLQAQEKALRAFCAQHGWRLCDELLFTDGLEANASGADYDLPGWRALMEAARQGRMELVVVRSDRFARDQDKAGYYTWALGRLGVQVIYTDLGLAAQRGSQGKLMKGVYDYVNEEVREGIMRNTRAGRHAKLDSGLFVGSGPTPFGYVARKAMLTGVKGGTPQLRTVGLAIEPNAAALVQRIFRAAVTRSTDAIALELNTEGTRPVMGRADRWRAPSLHFLLTNPIYLGRYRYGERLEQLAPDVVPPLVSVEEWERAQRALAGRLQLRGRATKSVGEDIFELRGMVRCGSCGYALCARVAPDRRRQYYRCESRMPGTARRRNLPQPCACGLVPLVPLHAYVRDTIVATLQDPERFGRRLAAERDAFAQEDARRAERLAYYAEQIAHERRVLKRIVERSLTEDDALVRDLLAEKERESAKRVHKLEAECAALRAAPSRGPSAAEIDDLETQLLLLAGTGPKLRACSSSERAELYRRLQLSVEVRLAETSDVADAIELGVRRYVVRLSARVELARPGQSGEGFWKPQDLLLGASAPTPTAATLTWLSSARGPLFACSLLGARD